MFCKRWAPCSLTSLSPTLLFTVGTLAMPPQAGRAPKLFSLCLLFPVKSTTICLEGKLITPHQREDFGSVRHVQVDRLSPSKLPSHMDTDPGVALPGKSTISAVKNKVLKKTALAWPYHHFITSRTRTIHVHHRVLAAVSPLLRRIIPAVTASTDTRLDH